MFLGSTGQVSTDCSLCAVCCHGVGWVMGVKVLVVEETTLVAPVGKDWGCPVLEQLVPHC